MNVSSWLKTANRKISKLDSELILAHTLNQERIFLHAHPDYELSEKELEQANLDFERRQKHEPIAYIVGQKEFYGRSFCVNYNTLIPRPETESLINFVKSYTSSHFNSRSLEIVDVGTGCGCIAVTLALELPNQPRITATDISSKAIECAQYNAQKLGAKSISIIKSNLLSSRQLRKQKFDVIVANLPYVDKEWPWLSSELQYEPKIALYAKDHGLKVIKQLLKTAQKHLTNDGIIVLEADISQHDDIIDYATNYGLVVAQNTESQNPIDRSQNQSLVLALRLQKND